MIGPWLAAKTPTRSAIGTPLPSLPRVQARDDGGLRQAADLEVEAQQIGVDERRDLPDVALEQRLADVRLDLVAADDARHVGAIFSRQLRVVMQIEEQLAHPVIGHRRPLLQIACARARGRSVASARARRRETYLRCGCCRSAIAGGGWVCLIT